MKITMGYPNCWRWLLPVLAVLFAFTVRGQGTIVYVHAPLSNPNGNPNQLPWDSQGTQVGADFPIVINGETVLAFSTPMVLGQPSALVVRPSFTSAIIGQQPYLDVPDNVWAVPLSVGTEIGSTAAGYSWLRGDGDCLLTAARDGGIIGQPSLTAGYFTGLESAYLGFRFQQSGEAYYGWVRIGCPVAAFNAGWVYEYAYETRPNTLISAGAVPEPSAMALFTVAGIALLGLRRH